MFGEGLQATVSQSCIVKDSRCTVVGNRGWRGLGGRSHRGQGRCVVWLRCVAQLCAISEIGLLAIPRG